MGAELADIDNDGDLDAIVGFGAIDPRGPQFVNSRSQPDAVYLNDGQGYFEDTWEEWGFEDLGASRGFAAADLDGDGFLDLLKRDLRGRNSVYRSRCSRAAWLIVRLRNPESPNRFAVGATIAVETGGRVQERTILAGGTNYAYGGPPEAHFGLDDHYVVDAITVTWPDGATSRFEGVESRRAVTITSDP